MSSKQPQEKLVSAGLQALLEQQKEQDEIVKEAEAQATAEGKLSLVQKKEIEIRKIQDQIQDAYKARAACEKTLAELSNKHQDLNTRLAVLNEQLFEATKKSDAEIQAEYKAAQIAEREVRADAYLRALEAKLISPQEALRLNLNVSPCDKGISERNRANRRATTRRDYT